MYRPYMNLAHNNLHMCMNNHMHKALQKGRERKKQKEEKEKNSWQKDKHQYTPHVQHHQQHATITSTKQKRNCQPYG